MPEQAERKLTQDAKVLLGNYFAMDQVARESLILLSDGMAKNMPSDQYHLISLFPRSWRPSLLRFLLCR